MRQISGALVVIASMAYIMTLLLKQPDVSYAWALIPLLPMIIGLLCMMVGADKENTK